MRKITIIGLGLIGGSLSKAFRKYFSPAPFIHAVDTDKKTLAAAKREGIINSSSDKIDHALFGSGAVFICTPIKGITRCFAEAALFAPDAIITDTGSVKSEICKEAQKKGIRFIGGHPMAGSQDSGYTHAKEFLFENAYYLLTPLKDVAQQDVDIFEELLSSIGAFPIVTDPDTHDAITAYISHIPHVIAALLVNAAANADDENGMLKMLAAGGFRDITRIASSDARMWNSVCALNKSNIFEGLAEFSSLLDRFVQALRMGKDLTPFFENAKKYRDTLEIKSASAYMNEHQIFVDITDKPGMIAVIAKLLGDNGVNIRNIGIVNSREYENGVLQVVLETAQSLDKSLELLRDTGFKVYRK